MYVVLENGLLCLSRNLGQTEETSCYLIFLKEPNGGGEGSSLLLTHHSHPISENQKRSSRCHRVKATRHDCPIFHVFRPGQLGPAEKAGDGQ